jgi:hypothetical protein
MFIVSLQNMAPGSEYLSGLIQTEKRPDRKGAEVQGFRIQMVESWFLRLLYLINILYIKSYLFKPE